MKKIITVASACAMVACGGVSLEVDETGSMHPGDQPEETVNQSTAKPSRPTTDDEEQNGTDEFLDNTTSEDVVICKNGEVNGILDLGEGSCGGRDKMCACGLVCEDDVCVSGERPSEANLAPLLAPQEPEPPMVEPEPAPVVVIVEPEPEEIIVEEVIAEEEEEVAEQATSCTLTIQSTETVMSLGVQETASNLRVVPTTQGFSATWRFGGFGEENGEPIHIGTWSSTGTAIGDGWTVDQTKLVGFYSAGDQVLIDFYDDAGTPGTWFDLQENVVTPMESHLQEFRQTTKDGIFYVHKERETESAGLYHMTPEGRSLVASVDMSPLMDKKMRIEGAAHREDTIAMMFTVEDEEKAERGIELLIQQPDGSVAHATIVQYQILEEELERNTLMVAGRQLLSVEGGFLVYWYDYREDWYATHLTFVSDDGEVMWDRSLWAVDYLAQLPNGMLIGTTHHNTDGTDGFGIVVLNGEGVEQEYLPLSRTADLNAIAGHFTENAFSVVWSENTYNEAGVTQVLFGSCE